ncbi:hypothetical protein [Lewinella sp. IMCC34183]|nr:hypothetical protein [Lewinella sp. IMCC34183]
MAIKVSIQIDRVEKITGDFLLIHGRGDGEAYKTTLKKKQI